MARAPKAFQKAAENNAQDFDFAGAVAEAYELFPHIKNNVFFIDVSTGKLVHPDEEIRQRVNGFMNSDDGKRADINTDIFTHKRDKASSVAEIGVGDAQAFFVLLYLKPDMQSALGQKHDITENMHLVFDHELAHAVLKQAHGPKLLSESTADAYAALRHFQRYGTDNQTIEKLMKRRAALGFLNQDPDHFTSPALEKVLSVKHDVDFKALTPDETAAAATYLAKAGAMKKDNIRRLSRHFNQFAVKQPPKNDKLLRKLAETVFKARSPDLKKWSEVALKAFLDKDIKLKAGRKTVKLEGPYWDKARARLSRSSPTA